MFHWQRIRHEGMNFTFLSSLSQAISLNGKRSCRFPRLLFLEALKSKLNFASACFTSSALKFFFITILSAKSPGEFCLLMKYSEKLLPTSFHPCYANARRFYNSTSHHSFDVSLPCSIPRTTPIHSLALSLSYRQCLHLSTELNIKEC